MSPVSTESTLFLFLIYKTSLDALNDKTWFLNILKERWVKIIKKSICLQIHFHNCCIIKIENDFPFKIHLSSSKFYFQEGKILPI